MQDSLGDRMKGYESQTTFQTLTPLTPIVARLDGKSFHTFTKGLERPYDKRLSDLMVATTTYLAKETNASIAYTQSDEISLIWINREEKIDKEVFFNGKLFKMNSVLASMCSTYFNKHLSAMLPEKADAMPLFDCRVFPLPTLWEAANYLYWREKDATKNSISMAAQSVYSHNALHGKNSSDKQELLFQKGINWNDYPTFFKKGTYIARKTFERAFTAIEMEVLPAKHAARTNPELKVFRQDFVELEIPPLSKVSNKAAVLFDNATPESK